MSNENNRGAIWGNDRKIKDTHPDFKGQATIDGKEYWVSAWKRRADAKPNAPSLSFAFDLKEQDVTPSATPQAQPAVDVDSEIPF